MFSKVIRVLHQIGYSVPGNLAHLSQCILKLALNIVIHSLSDLSENRLFLILSCTQNEWKLKFLLVRLV